MRRPSLAFLGASGPIVLAFALAAGCSGESSASSPASSVVSSSLTRDTAPNAPAADQAQLATDNTAFAFDLYRAISGAGADANLFYSPYSISIALAMTYAGAVGSTATQMASALHFDLPPARLNPAFDAIDLALASRAAGNQGADGQPFRLNVADSLWGDRSTSFAAPFLDTLAVDYGSAVHVADFAGSPDPSRLEINQWVSDETAGIIPSLLPEGSITPDTRVVLVNAIDFDAAWAMPFDPSATASAPFTRLDGSIVQVPEMSNVTSMNYAETATYQAVELPYSGNQTSMIVVLPAAGQFSNVELAMNAGLYSQVAAGLASQGVQLSLPRFTIDGATLSLKSALTSLGMSDAFTDQADFSAMVVSDPVFLSDVVHQAFVAVTESGTVAAAATGVIARDTAAFLAPKIVDVNRPFFFFIRDIPTGTLLFVGRATDPSQ